jgi:1,2-diacylglycerol 3-beta-galactosyltransferase
MDYAMKRILILMSDTGGGHRASAEAIRDAFRERYGARFQVEMVDLWIKHTPPPLSHVPKAYRFLVDDVPWLYRFMYEVGERPQMVEALMRATARFLQPFVGRAIRAHDPDLIVSVHPLMQEIPLNVLAQMRWDVPFVTVVTDLVTIPPVWFEPGATLCFVPSEEGLRLALRAGLRAEQLRQYGLPIRPAFAGKPRPQAVLRQELGMAPELPSALIVGGGEGMGQLGDITRAVAARLAVDAQGKEQAAGQLVVICGRNQKLEQQLTAYPWPVPTIVKGFVEEIWDWMAASDCVVTKAGPGTIAEALALGLPILLSGYVPGQESGNVPYVLKHGVGVYVEDPRQIAEVISGWFGTERANLEQMAEKARQMGRPQAAYQIAEEIAGLLDEDRPGRKT